LVIDHGLPEAVLALAEMGLRLNDLGIVEGARKAASRCPTL
jgi:hypothetical protein